MIKFERNKLFTSDCDFYDLCGSSIMKLDRKAARLVCEVALSRGVLISRVEGGIWHNPGFEARTDCIWDGIDQPATEKDVSINNLNAQLFVIRESVDHDVFIITVERLIQS